MIHKCISYLYELPIPVYFLLAAVCLAVWSGAALCLGRKKQWRILNGLAFGAVVGLIVVITQINRNASYVGYSLIPFSSFALAKTYVDIYSEVALNGIMFLPLGLTLPYAIKNSAKHPVLITMAVSFAFSVAIEMCQYIFNTGYAEIDDVIFNTFGAAIGTLSFLFTNRVLNKDRHSK